MRKLWALAAIVALAGSGAVVAAPAQAAITDPQTVVSLTFDDADADQQLAVAILDAHDLKGTFFVPSGYLGAPGYLSLDEVTALFANGHEIGGHSVTHADLTAASPDEARRQVCADRANLMEWGFSPTSFAYPYAAVNATAEQIVNECGYNSGRGLGDIESRFGCTGCGFAENVPPQNPFNTRALDQVDATWTLEDLQNAVVNAEESGGGWLQLTFHRFCDDGCSPIGISPGLFQQFIEWLEPRALTENTIVRTVGEVIGGPVQPAVDVTEVTPPAPRPGVNAIVNPSLEIPGPTSPHCWTPYGYGFNTPITTTSSPGRTGAVASVIAMTEYTDGDARIMPTLDLGECAPTVTPGHTYSLRGWYTSTAVTQFAVYLRSGIGTWTYWTSSPWFPATDTFMQAVWETPVIPPGSTGLSFGLNIFADGELRTDDYAMFDTDGAPPASEEPTPTAVYRLHGADRYITAAAVSQAFDTGVERVYIASGLNYPDALSAAPAAAAFNSPLLIVRPDSIPVVIRSELDRLAPKQIIVVGGSAVVSNAVLAELQTIAPTKRVAGVDRYATSRAIASEAFPNATVAYVATGTNYPDALSASPAASTFNAPLILVRGDAGSVDTATRSLLTGLGVASVVLVGGNGAVSTGIEAAVTSQFGAANVKRVHGVDRYATAAALNADAFGPSASIYLASGENFPDALVGAPLAGIQDAPIYLSRTTCLPTPTSVAAHRDETLSVTLLGGQGVLTPAVELLTPCG